MEQALSAYTIDAAYQLGMEGRIGSLEVGKFADLVVLDKNLIEIPTEKISEINVLMTMMNGAVTHGFDFAERKISGLQP